MSFDLLLRNGTFSLGASGDLDLVTGQKKLSQDIIKIIATAVGTNLAHRWYGSIIAEKIVGSGLRLDLLKTEIVKNIQFCLQNLKSLQEQQARAGQILVPEGASNSIVFLTDEQRDYVAELIHYELPGLTCIVICCNVGRSYVTAIHWQISSHVGI